MFLLTYLPTYMLRRNVLSLSALILLLVNRHIIDFIKETHFSTYCGVCYVHFTVAK